MTRSILFAALAAAMAVGATSAQAESFAYHGTLQDAGKPASGNYDLQLTLYSAQSGGAVMAGPITLYDVAVHNGVFSTNVDFGATAKLTSQSYLDVRVKPSDSSAGFAQLDSRAAVTPAGSVCPLPWSLDGNAGTNPTTNYVGTADNQVLRLSANGESQALLWPGGGVSMPGGFGGAAAPESFAGGEGAVSNPAYARSFVWGGGTSGNILVPSISASGPGQFLVQAPGGVAINTSKGEWGGALQDELTIAPTTGLPGASADLALLSSAGNSATGFKGFDIGVAPSGQTFDINGLYNIAGPPQQIFYDQLLDIGYSHAPRLTFWHLNGATGSNPFQIAASGDTLNGNGAYLTPTGVWTNASSRTFKEGFQSIDAVGVLEKLVAMPVQTWFYKGNHDGLHMGPVAEDFAQVFGLGGNEKYIGTVDESGVALAAIQGLNKKLETENTALHSQLDAVLARLDHLETRKGE